MKKFKFIIDGHKYEVAVDEIEENVASVEVNGTPFTVQIESEKKVAKTTVRAAKVATTTAAAPASKGTATTVKAPLPGSIMKVLVTEGQSVKRGDVLLTMESMKMENNVLAETDGVVTKLFVEAGKNVLQDEKLLDIEATATAAPVEKPAAAPAPAAPKAPEAPKAAAPVAGGIKVKAPLPGSVLKIVAAEGQSVKRGDVLLTLESMKMENSIMAEKDGVVKSILVAPGQNVQQDDVLVVLE